MYPNEKDYDIGYVLFRLRNDRGHKIREAADGIGIAHSTYGRTEKSKNKVSFQVIYRACVFYELSIYDFIHYKRGKNTAGANNVTPDVNHANIASDEPLTTSEKKEVLSKIILLKKEIENLEQMLIKK